MITTEKPNNFKKYLNQVDTKPVSVSRKEIQSGTDTKPVNIIRAQPLQPPSTTRAAQNKLGVLLAKYTGNHLSAIGWFVFLFLGFVIFFVALLTTLWQYWEYGQTYGLVFAEKHTRYWFILTIFLLIIFILCLIYQVRLSFRYIKLYENGLRYRTGFFSSGTVFHDGIKGISLNYVQEKFLGMSWHSKQQILITRNEGKKIIFGSGFNQLDDLGEQLKFFCYPLLTAKLADQYQSGKWLDFGVIQINSSGLGVENKIIPWKNIRSVQVNSAKLNLGIFQGSSEISSTNEVIRLHTKEILNLELLLEFIQAGTLI